MPVKEKTPIYVTPPREVEPITTMPRGDRSTTKSTWMRTASRVELPDGLIPPALDMSVVKSPDAILEAGMQDQKTRPIFLGAKARLNERRLARVERKLGGIDRANEVHRFIGENAYKGIFGQAFRHPSEKYRPTTYVERTTAGILEKLVTGKRIRHGYAYKHAVPYLNDQVGPKSDMGVRPRLNSPNFDRPGVHRSWPEIKHDGKNEKRYNKLNRQAERREKLIKHIINRPYNKAAKHVETREHLIRQRAAIEQARQSRNKTIRKTALKTHLAATIASIAAKDTLKSAKAKTQRAGSKAKSHIKRSR